MNKMIYAEAEAIIKLATGLNSTNATLRRWPVKVTSGSSILYSGPPSGNSQSYITTIQMKYTIIVKSAEELIICSSLKGLKSKSHKSPLQMEYLSYIYLWPVRRGNWEGILPGVLCLRIQIGPPPPPAGKAKYFAFPLI